MIKYLATLFCCALAFSCYAMHEVKEYARIQLVILDQVALDLDPDCIKTNCTEDYLRGYIYGMHCAYEDIMMKY